MNSSGRLVNKISILKITRYRFQIISLLFSFFIFSAVQAKKVIIGSGSGSVSQTSMTGLSAGDTIAIAPGTYAGGGNFSNLHDLTIINNGGVVTFTGTVNWGGSNMHNIRWTGGGYVGAFYGFVFNTSTGIYGQTTHSDSCRFDHLDFENASAAAFDFGDSNYGITYNGNSSTFKMHCLTFSDIKVFNSAFFIITGYNGPASNANNLCDSIDMHNIIIQDLQGAGQQVRGNITHFDMYNWTITYSGHNTNIGDQGILYVTGNGSIHHNYMHGGRGYLARINAYSLKPLQDSILFYNNIILSTTYYGGLDIRCDSTGNGLPWNTAPFLNPIKNVYVINNTVGNKWNELNFVVPIVLQYQMHNNNILFCKNNLSFAADPNISGLPKSGILVSYNGGSGKIDSSNNRYFSADAILSYLQDTLATCRPTPTSSLNNGGIPYNFLQTDFYNKIRPSLPSVGAVEYAGITSSVIANAGADQTITLPLDSVSLSGQSSSATNSTISNFQWSQISGPSVAILGTPNNVTTTASTLKAGKYMFGLLVINNYKDSSKSTVSINVNPKNQPPVANAGLDQTITSPISSVTVDGSLSTDSDGTIVSYNWSQVSGPSSSIIANPNSSKTNISSLVPGIYIFKLTVTDNQGLSANSQISINVNVATAINTINSNTNDSIIVFPNPTSSFINLEMSNSKIGLMTISIIDVNGNLILNQKVNKASIKQIFPININHLKIGTYFLSADFDKLVKINSKFIKE